MADATLGRLNGEMALVLANVGRSLVQVRRGRLGVGAGTVWHADGLLLTNAHVVAGRGRRGALARGAEGIDVVLPDGRVLPARILALDERRDLAALSVPASGLPAITLGDSRALRPGSWVIAVGHPWGVVGAATAGTVIAVGPPPELHTDTDFIQVGLHLRPGHSGGPLIDSEGRLVGINAMITGPDVGLAVPVHEVVKFLREWRRS